MTDAEETEIYGTNAYVPDTDGDTFVDLNELLNLFNPAKPQPSTLLDNPGVREFRAVGREVPGDPSGRVDGQ